MCSGTAILPVSCSSAPASIAFSVVVVGDAQLARQRQRALLHAADVIVRHLVFGVDRRGQRFDGGEQQPVELARRAAGRPRGGRTTSAASGSRSAAAAGSARSPCRCTSRNASTSSSETDAPRHVARHERPVVLRPHARTERPARRQRDRRRRQAAVDREIASRSSAPGGEHEPRDRRRLMVERAAADQEERAAPPPTSTARGWRS